MRRACIHILALERSRGLRTYQVETTSGAPASWSETHLQQVKIVASKAPIRVTSDTRAEEQDALALTGIFLEETEEDRDALQSHQAVERPFGTEAYWRLKHCVDSVHEAAVAD